MINTQNTQQSYRRGAIYAIAAGVVLSTSGMVVRFISEADAWTVLFYRSLAFFVTVVVFMGLRGGQSLSGQFRALKWPDLIISIALAFGFIFYVLSLFNTTVANTVLLLSTGPFIAALLGFIVLREVVSLSTLVAMVIAGLGITIMMSGGIAPNDLLGMLYALLAVAAFAVMIVALRSNGPERDMLAATALAGVFGALFCLPFLVSLKISFADLVLSLIFGSFQVGVGFILITLASRSVPSAQVPLLALGETAFAPLWVWLLVNEVPAKNTLTGGSLVFAAVVISSLITARSEATSKAP